MRKARLYLGRIFEHFGVLGDETHADAGSVHLRRAARVREGGRASQHRAFDFLYACVPGNREVLGVQRQRWQRRTVDQAATAEPRAVCKAETE